VRRLIAIALILLFACTTAYSIEKDQWADPHSWPATTKIEGKEVKLRMYRRTEVYVSEIPSALMLKANEGCAAGYYYTRDGIEVLHGPSYSWKPGGKIEQKSFNLDGRLQYLYRYYPSGKVINSIIYDKKANQVITSWFEKSGKLAGQYIANNKPAGKMRLEDNMYFWNGKKVSADEYTRRITSYMMISAQ